MVMFCAPCSTVRKEWLDLKQEYLTLQKHCMAHLKQSVSQINLKSLNCDIAQTKEKNNACKLILLVHLFF